jgi:hypothetical protein
MRFTGLTAKFEARDNPTPENMLALDPTLVIPTKYKGENPSPELAALFVNYLHKRPEATFETLNAGIPVESSKISLYLYNLFIAQAARFGIRDAQTVFYTLSDSLQLEKPAHFFYLLTVADQYNGATVSVAATLKQLYSFGEGTDENGLITLETLEHYFKLHETLRAEGIMLNAKDVFICSYRWGDNEVLDLLLRGMEISEAIRLYEVGFTTMEEIIEYYGALPDSWITKMLG